MDTKSKARALESFTEIRKMLDSPEPLDGVRKVILRGLVEYAEEQVAEIQEVKRARKTEPRLDFVNHRGE